MHLCGTIHQRNHSPGMKHVASHLLHLPVLSHSFEYTASPFFLTDARHQYRDAKIQFFPLVHQVQAVYKNMQWNLYHPKSKQQSGHILPREEVQEDKCFQNALNPFFHQPLV